MAPSANKIEYSFKSQPFNHSPIQRSCFSIRVLHFHWLISQYPSHYIYQILSFYLSLLYITLSRPRPKFAKTSSPFPFFFPSLLSDLNQWPAEAKPWDPEPPRRPPPGVVKPASSFPSVVLLVFSRPASTPSVSVPVLPSILPLFLNTSPLRYRNFQFSFVFFSKNKINLWVLCNRALLMDLGFRIFP